MKYITNHQWRNLTYGYELTDAERKDFDYVKANEFNSHDFLRYRGRIFDVSEFIHAEMMSDWDGYHADSYFSGVVIKLSEDGERCKVATYII